MKLDDLIPESQKLREKAVKFLGDKKKTFTELANFLEVSPFRAEQVVEELKEKGYRVKIKKEEELDEVGIERSATAINTRIEKRFKKKVRIGIISDTHLGSVDERLADLHEIYLIFYRENINVVYHAGNIVDGAKSFPGHENEIKIHGFDKQLEYCINNYPCVDGIVTRFIGSSTCHEGSWFKREGLEIGHLIAEKRKDMDYLGLDDADVFFGENENVKLKIMHPGGGTAYAISYRPQKIIESFSGGEKPNILVLGHFHKMGIFPIRNVEVVLAGCVQDQTSFMRKKSIEAMKGAYILEFNIDDNGISRFYQQRFPLW